MEMAAFLWKLGIGLLLQRCVPCEGDEKGIPQLSDPCEIGNANLSILNFKCNPQRSTKIICTVVFDSEGNKRSLYNEFPVLSCDYTCPPNRVITPIQTKDGVCTTCSCIECTISVNEDVPVCGNNGKSYSNICKMQDESCNTFIDIKLQYYGRCVEDAHCKVFEAPNGSPACPYPLVPRLQRETQCQCVCPDCGYEFYPVCSSNRVTFQNKCWLERSACSSNAEVKPSIFGLCDYGAGTLLQCRGLKCPLFSTCIAVSSSHVTCQCTKVCFEGYSPVLGLDNFTYSNGCFLGAWQCMFGGEPELSSGLPERNCATAGCPYYGFCHSFGCSCYPGTDAPGGHTPVGEYGSSGYGSGYSGVGYGGPYDSSGYDETEYGVGDSGVGTANSIGDSGVGTANSIGSSGVGTANSVGGSVGSSDVSDSSVVCGIDGNLYKNEDEIRSEACRRRIPIYPVSTLYCPQLARRSLVGRG